MRWITFTKWLLPLVYTITCLIVLLLLPKFHNLLINLLILIRDISPHWLVDGEEEREVLLIFAPQTANYCAEWTCLSDLDRQPQPPIRKVSGEGGFKHCSTTRQVLWLKRTDSLHRMLECVKLWSLQEIPQKLYGHLFVHVLPGPAYWPFGSSQALVLDAIR